MYFYLRLISGCVLMLVGIPFASAQQPPQVPVQVAVVTIAGNAMLGVTPVSNGTTIFSGDLLKTGENGRLQIQSGSIQFVLDANSAARIFRAGDQVLVEVEGGSVSYSARGISEHLVLYAQDIKFVPATTEPAVGQITIVSRCEVKATALRSTLEATSGKETRTIESNKSYSVLSEIGVEYNESWKPTLPDYPQYPRDANYHHSHNHVACAPGVWKQRPPLQAGNQGHFKYALIGAAAIGTAIPVIKAMESPDAP